MPAPTISPAMTQMNVRIESELKRAGDAALRAAGFTPSEAIRALWERVSDLGDKPADIHALLRPDEFEAQQAEAEAERQRRIEWARRGPKIVEDFYREQGLSWPPKNDPISDEELRYLMFEERFGA